MAIINVLRDITERKRAEEILKKEQRTLKHLLQSSDHERQTHRLRNPRWAGSAVGGSHHAVSDLFPPERDQPKLAAKAYDAGMTMLQQGHFEARRLIAGVRPPILDESGVVAAVAHLVNEQSRLEGTQDRLS